MYAPLVSVLIPVYNREILVRKTIESAVNQTYDNIEIIVIDNQSTDGTFEVIQEYAERYDNVWCFQNDVNMGPVLNWVNFLVPI